MSGEITREDLDHFERTLEALLLEVKLGDAEMFNLLAIHGACVTAAVDKEREACALKTRVLAQKVMAAYNAADRHIPDSDLDDEQPLTLDVHLTLGDIRRTRRALAEIERGG
jgi:hypothetical protein